MQTNHVRLIHFTTPKLPTEKLQAVFSVANPEGNESIILGSCLPTDLYETFSRNGWIKKAAGRPGVVTPITGKAKQAQAG